MVEVYTPSGNWSSYPPHKHDVHKPPGEVDLEEIYYYRMDRPEGYAIQRVYTPDRSLDETLTVRDGEMVLIPEGYHPVVAAHGYNVYYLNALAGSARSMAASDDPDYAWVREDMARPGPARSAGHDGMERIRGDRMQTQRMTMAQALVGFLKNQYVERDGSEHRSSPVLGHLRPRHASPGIGQALQQNPDFRYYQCRNEQAAVHIAAAFAKTKNRLRTFACISSIGPGATNMITGAALATINRLPVLLLPGDIFARRNVAPVLQQLESEHSQDISVNDCFKPVSRYWDRINRPDQLIIRAAGSDARADLARRRPARSRWRCRRTCRPRRSITPTRLFEKRVWHDPRGRCPSAALLDAGRGDDPRARKRPLIVAGGGVLYSEATEALARFRRADRHSGRRDAGRQGLAALRSSAESRRDRRDRHSRREHRWRATPTW